MMMIYELQYTRKEALYKLRFIQSHSNDDDSLCRQLKSHWARLAERNELILCLSLRKDHSIVRSPDRSLVHRRIALSRVCLSRPHCTHTSQYTQNFFGVSEFGVRASRQASRVRSPCAFSDSSSPSPSPFRLINAISAWMERWFLFYLSLTGLGSVLIARPLESAFAAAAADKSIERKLNWTSLIYLFILFSISTHTTHTNCVQWLFIFNSSLYIKCACMCVY